VPEGLKKRWHDPVWSKVIASAIVFGSGVVLAVIYSFPIKALVIASYTDLGNLLGSTDRNLVQILTGTAALLASWLSILVLSKKLRPCDPTKFEEHFSHELENWEFSGGWSLENLVEGRTLIVTDSEVGGISKWCLSWKDYVFEFDTKLIASDCGWLIRAMDLENYVMLQLREKEILPHFLRDRGNWFRDFNRRAPLQFQIPLGRWFRVRIRVENERVVTWIVLDGKEKEVLNLGLLQPGPRKVWPLHSEQITIIDVSYPHGSIGFRAWGDEQAFFRNIRVEQIHNV